MSQIDLKKSTVYLRDGYSLAGAVNNASGYAIGASVVAVDTFVGAVEVGIYLHFAGHATRYTVTARTNTLGNTTSITVTPVLTAAIVDNEVITTGPHSLAMKNGEGTVQFTEHKAREYKLNRGLLDEVRDADEQPMDLTFDLLYEFLESESGATTPTPREVLYKENAASAWVSSDSDLCRPYAVDVIVEYDPNCSGTAKEVVTFPDFRFEQLTYDIKAGTIQCQGKCNITHADPSRPTVF